MPPIHRSTLRVIVEHLSRVAANSTQNKMDAKVSPLYRASEAYLELIALLFQNLAVIFGKTLFGEDELPKDGDLKNFKVGKVSEIIALARL